MGVPAWCQLSPSTRDAASPAPEPGRSVGQREPSKQSPSAPVSAGAGGDPAWHMGWDRRCRFSSGQAGHAAFLRPEQGGEAAAPAQLLLHAKAKHGLIRPLLAPISVWLRGSGSWESIRAGIWLRGAGAGPWLSRQRGRALHGGAGGCPGAPRAPNLSCPCGEKQPPRGLSWPQKLLKAGWVTWAWGGGPCPSPRTVVGAPAFGMRGAIPTQPQGVAP